MKKHLTVVARMKCPPRKRTGGGGDKNNDKNNDKNKNERDMNVYRLNKTYYTTISFEYMLYLMSQQGFAADDVVLYLKEDNPTNSLHLHVRKRQSSDDDLYDDTFIQEIITLLNYWNLGEYLMDKIQQFNFISNSDTFEIPLSVSSVTSSRGIEFHTEVISVNPSLLIQANIHK